MHLTGHVTGSLWLDEILVGALQFVEGRPLLPVPIHKLAFILANRTIVRRFNTWRVLRAAGRANGGLHGFAGHSTSAITTTAAVRVTFFIPSDAPPSRCFDNNL